MMAEGGAIPPGGCGVTGESPERPGSGVCMICFQRPARYFGSWAQEGPCKPCIDAMEPGVRLRVIRDMHAEYRKRWQLDSRLDL